MLPIISFTHERERERKIQLNIEWHSIWILLTRRHSVAHGSTSIFIGYSERLFRLMNSILLRYFLGTFNVLRFRWNGICNGPYPCISWFWIYERWWRTTTYESIYIKWFKVFIFVCVSLHSRNRNRTANDAHQLISLTLTVSHPFPFFVVRLYGVW